MSLAPSLGANLQTQASEEECRTVGHATSIMTRDIWLKCAERAILVVHGSGAGVRYHLGVSARIDRTLVLPQLQVNLEVDG